MDETTVSKIKQWLKLESELKMLALESKKRKLEKKKLTDEVMEVMKSNG